MHRCTRRASSPSSSVPAAVTRVDITVYGPRTELHSGHYGNWAPNPAMSLARLLASMKDDSGRVLVEHFYDDVEPLGPVEKQALADAPAIDTTPDGGALARFDRRRDRRRSTS